MIVILGLGNPGKKFEKTRHNVGFLVLDKIKEKWQGDDFKFIKKFLAEISSGKFFNRKIILVKPQTFMNNSGQSAKAIVSHFNLKLENLWVVHDDLDIKLGKMKVSFARGSAGHKGVQSIIDELKTKKFLRFRLGIGPDDKKRKLSENFVLEKFKRNEFKILNKVIEETILKIEDFIKGLKNF